MGVRQRLLLSRTHLSSSFTAVQPTQVTSPLPANARDEDLLTGIYTDRPPSVYTVVSNTLIWIQFAKILQQGYSHLDEHPTLHSHDFVLKLDAQMQAVSGGRPRSAQRELTKLLLQIIAQIPTWMREGGPTEGMPPAQCSAWVRTTFAISSAHKVLVSLSLLYLQARRLANSDVCRPFIDLSFTEHSATLASRHRASVLSMLLAPSSAREQRLEMCACGPYQ